jgi:hypothetical protein
MNARDEIHGLSRVNMDMFERSAARAFLGSQSVEGKDDHEHPTKPCGISLLAGAVWLLTGPVAKVDVVTDWKITAGDKSLPCISTARLSPLMGWPGRAQRPNLLDCGWEA